MDAPKCRLCGARHYGLCSPVTIGAGTVVHPDGRAVQAADLVPGREYVVNLNDPQPVLTPAPRGTFDRNAYQREYMRKRRATAKR